MRNHHPTWILATALAFVLIACDGGETTGACDPACDLDACMACDTSGDTAQCVSLCGDGLTCEAGQCVAEIAPTCDPTCGPCQACDTSGDTPACVDVCSEGLSCQDGVCVAPEEAACEPACGDCQACDTTGAAPVCVDLCAEGTTCNAGRCEADPVQAAACDPACSACQVCDVSSGSPVCVDACGASEACVNDACVRQGFHASFAALQGPFASGSEVTQACIGCHADAADHVLQTAHWNWQGDTPGLTGHDGQPVGKANLINNFCIAIKTNEARCTQCHAGYGWKDDTFDFSDASKIDCLACHADLDSGYTKDPKTAGLPPASVDLALAATSVGQPERDNCGFCHFNAGGGDNVKKGDLGSALTHPTVAVDVHMGAGMTCANCHAGEAHTLLGQGVHLPVSEGRLACADCHGAAPHTNEALNNHALDIDCQTCHVPAFSRTQPTKMDWDWSTAGNKTIGNDGVETGTLADGTVVQTYNFQKGHFVWEKNVAPEYAWYDGRTERMTVTDTFPAGQGSLETPVILGRPVAAKTDAAARIFPFKVMRGKQPVHTSLNLVLVPKLFGPGSFWAQIPAADAYTEQGVKDLWTASLQTGARAAGQIAADATLTEADWAFAYTEMYMGINHEVAPADQALGCTDCHGANGRMDWQALGYTCDPMTGGASCGSRN